MSRYNTATIRPAQKQSAIKSGTRAVVNHQGGVGYLRNDDKSELFLSAATSFVTDKFYETASDLRTRQQKLVASVAIDDPEWMLAFVLWLRTEANLRTGAVVIAAEAVAARLAAKQRGQNRQIIGAALQRPDEPGEMLGYWTSHYGRNLPKPVKRGVADAVARLYNERAFLKYDSPKHAYRFADVIRITHPTMPTDRGDLLARHIVRGGVGTEIVDDALPMLANNKFVRQWKPAAITQAAENGELAEVLSKAGMTWEDIPSLVNGPWTAHLWEAVIPSMGAMALIRNLRNFDAAGVSQATARDIAAKLADPETIRRSRLLPFRMLTAFKQVTNVRWAAPLEAALQASLTNIPALTGRTLILVDCSGSMFGYDTVSNAEKAALFGAALALRAESATLVHYGTNSREVRVPKGGSILPMVNAVQPMGGTDTWGAAARHFTGHDRVILLTDEQDGGSGWYWGRSHTHDSSVIPQSTPLITFNLAGYRTGGVKQGPNRMTFASLSDSAFKLIDLLGNGSSQWPWEV